MTAAAYFVGVVSLALILGAINNVVNELRRIAGALERRNDDALRVPDYPPAP